MEDMRQQNEEIPTIHRFNAKVAREHGVPAGILFHDISYWVERNRKRRMNMKDGTAWTHDSRAALHRRHPYLSERQIKAAITTLHDAGLIETACLSKTAYDHTTWYTLGPQAPHYLKKRPDHPTETEKTSGEIRSNRLEHSGPIDWDESCPSISMIDSSLGTPFKSGFPERKYKDQTPSSGTGFKSSSPKEGDYKDLRPEEITDEHDFPTGRAIWYDGAWHPTYRPDPYDPECPESIKLTKPEKEGGAWYWKSVSRMGTQAR